MFSPEIEPPSGQLVVCAGVAVIDLVYRVEEFPAPGSKTRATEFTPILGGCAANASVAIRRLGGRARISAALGGPAGRDLIGDNIVAQLNRELVDTSHVVRMEGARSSLSSIFIDRSGERLIVNYRHPLLNAARPLDVEGVVAGAEAVLIDNRFPEFVLPIARAANAKGQIVVLDGEKPTRLADELLSIATHIVFSADGLRETEDERDLPTALRRVATRTRAFVGVTDGANGMMWLEGDALRQIPSFRVEVVDTLAAGDVFHGAFALALAERRPIPEAMRFAAATAAIKCTRFGGGAGTPERTEVEQFLAAHAQNLAFS